MLDQLEKFRDRFAADAKKNSAGRNAYIAVIIEDKVGALEMMTLGSGPCHGALQHYTLAARVSRNMTVKYILSWVMPILTSVATADDYFNWLANSSPWKDVFVTKDVADIKARGWVVSTDQAENFVASALIATRNVTEMYTDQVVARVPIYEEILRLGFSHEVAYIFSCTYNKAKSGKSLYPLTYMRLSSGHSPFELAYAEESYYRAFINGSPTNCHKKSFAEQVGYTHDVCSVWEKRDQKGAFQTVLEGLRPKIATAAKNYNIFEKIVTKGYLISSPDDLKSVLEQALERINHA